MRETFWLGVVFGIAFGGALTAVLTLFSPIGLVVCEIFDRLGAPFADARFRREEMCSTVNRTGHKSVIPLEGCECGKWRYVGAKHQANFPSVLILSSGGEGRLPENFGHVVTW